MINSEEIITTVDHPFYVKNQGFVKAGELIVGDELLDVNGNVLLVEKFNVELTDEPTTVYNFQVEDFHTYYVGGFRILVHNAGVHINVHRVIVKALGIKHGKKQRRILLMELFVILKQENQLTPMSLGIWGINLVMSLENIEQVHRNVV